MSQGGVTCTVSGKQITLNGTAMISFNFCLFPTLKVDDFSSSASIPVKANSSYHLSVAVISGYCNSSVTPWIRDSQGNIVQNGEGTFTPSAALSGCLGIWIPAGATFNNYIIEEQLRGTICGVSKITVNGIDYAVPQELFDGDSYSLVTGHGTTADDQPITGTPQTIPVTIPTTITNDNGGQMSVTYPAIFECLATTSRAFDDHTVHELMRMYTIQAAVANTDSVRRYIAPGVSFESHGQMYDLTNFKKESGSNNVTSVSAQHVGYRLLNYSIQPGYSFVGTIAQIAADMLNVAVDSNGKKANTEFQIGTTPDLGTKSFSLNNTDVVTAKYAIMALKNVGAESDFDNFTINFAQQIGGGQTQTFEFGVNMADVSITYDKSNGTTYEMGIADLQIKNPQDHPFDAGWYAHGKDFTTGEEFTKRIINYDKCWDDPTQDKITLGVFVSDVSTETAQMSIDIDHTVKQGEPYNNVDISHLYGFRSITGDGLMRTLNNATDGFVIQRLYNSNWVTIWQAESGSGKTIAYNLEHSQKVEMGGDYGYTTWTSTDHGATWTQTGGQGTDGNIEAGKLISTLYPLISAAIGQFSTSAGTRQGLGVMYDGVVKLALYALSDYASIQAYGVPLSIQNYLSNGATAGMIVNPNGSIQFTTTDGSSYGGMVLKSDGLHCDGGKNASFTIDGETFNVVDGIIRQ